MARTSEEIELSEVATKVEVVPIERLAEHAKMDERTASPPAPLNVIQDPLPESSKPDFEQANIHVYDG